MVWNGSLRWRTSDGADLMTHTSGLPPFKSIGARRRAKPTRLRTAQFSRSRWSTNRNEGEYSGPGHHLMTEIIQRLTGTDDELARSLISARWECKKHDVVPPKNLCGDFAARRWTMSCATAWCRGSPRPKCLRIGGISGHCRGVQHPRRICGILPDAVNGGFTGTAAAETRDDRGIHGAAGAGEEYAHAGLGGADRSGSSGHYFFGAQVTGNTGLRVRRFWIDPDRQLFVVLLTNRVHPTRENHKIAEVRAVHDA